MCCAANVQSGTNCPAFDFDGFHLPLSAGLHFLCHDLLDFHPSPGSLYAGLCFHVYPVTVYFGYFLAGSSSSFILESIFLAVSLNLRNQWIRTNQQYGSDLAGSLAGVSGLMDTSRSLFSDNLSGLSPASHAQPPACPGTSPEVKKRKLQPSFHLACNDQHDLYQYSGCCSGSCPERQDRLSHYGQKVKR